MRSCYTHARLCAEWTLSLRCLTCLPGLQITPFQWKCVLQLVWFMHWMQSKSWTSVGNSCILHWILARGTFFSGPKGATGKSTEAQSAKIRHIDLLLQSRPSGWTGFILYEQRCPAKTKWLLWPRLASSAGGGHGQEHLQEDPQLDLPDQLKIFKKGGTGIAAIWQKCFIWIQHELKIIPMIWREDWLDYSNVPNNLRGPAPRWQRECLKIGLLIDKRIKHLLMLYSSHTPTLCLRPMFVSACC